MARFTFTIESEEEQEMASLMGRMFVHPDTPKRAHLSSPLTHPDDEAEAAPFRRTRRTKAEMAEAAEAPPAEVDVEDEEVPAVEVTLDMVKAEGSKAMGAIKAGGVAAIFTKHGGGAESFGSLKPQHYAAVHAALVEANG